MPVIRTGEIPIPIVKDIRLRSWIMSVEWWQPNCYETGSFSAIYLYICSPLFMDFNWIVHDYLCGGDHFTTFLHYNSWIYTKMELQNVEWDEFKNKCKSKFISTPSIFEHENSNIHMKLFTSKLQYLSVSEIPKTSTVAKNSSFGGMTNAKRHVLIAKRH